MQEQFWNHALQDRQTQMKANRSGLGSMVHGQADVDKDKCQTTNMEPKTLEEPEKQNNKWGAIF